MIVGKQSILFEENVYIEETACVAGQKESEGPLGKLFDVVVEDAMAGMENWEEAESTLQQLAVDKLRSKSLEQTQMEAIEKAMEELEYQAHMDKPQARSLYEADVQFHMAIVGITENVMLQSICNYVDKITRRSRMVTIDRIFLDGEVENFLDLHRRIVKLLQDRDSAGIYAIVEEHYQYWAKVKDE